MTIFSSLVGACVKVIETVVPGSTAFAFKQLLINGQQSGLKKLVEAMAIELKDALKEGRNNEVEKLADVGVQAMTVALDNSGYEFASELAAIAVDLLKDAIVQRDTVLSSHLSETFVDGLYNATGEHDREVVRLIDERRKEFNKAVRNRDENLATTLSEAAVLLLLTSIKKQKKRLEDILAASWVTALTEAAENNQTLVARLVEGRTKAFNDAIAKLDTDLADRLSEAAVAVLLAAVEPADGTSPSPNLIEILSKSWVDALTNAVRIRKTFVEGLVNDRTDALSNAINARNSTKAATLSKAGVAVLLAAIKQQNPVLVKSLSKSWVMALAKAAAGGDQNWQTVSELIDERIKEFDEAILRRDMPKAKALAKAGAAIMLAAIEQGKLVQELADSLVRTLESALRSTYTQQEKDDLIKETVWTLKQDDKGVVDRAKATMLEAANGNNAGKYKAVVKLIEDNWN